MSINTIKDEGWSIFLFKAKNRVYSIIFTYDPYQEWLKLNEAHPQNLKAYCKKCDAFIYRPTISIVMPVWNTEKRCLQNAIDSIINQLYPNWELCIADDASTKPHVKKILSAYVIKDHRIKVKLLKENLNISGATNEALSLASGEFIGFMDHDDVIRPDALYHVVELLNRKPDLDLIYSDEDKIDIHGHKSDPFFKPDWSPDLLLSENYISHFSVVRRSLVNECGGCRPGFEGSQDYDLTLRISEKTDKISHIAMPLYSWRQVAGSVAAAVDAKPYAFTAAIRALNESMDRRAIKGDTQRYTQFSYRIRRQIIGDPLVSIIIVTRNKHVLRKCLESIQQKSTYNKLEIIIVNNTGQNISDETILKSFKHKILNYNEIFNYARMNNIGANAADGEYLVLLHDDTEIKEPGWIEAMLEQAQRQDVGLTGGLVIYAKESVFTGKIQHAGLLIGVGGIGSFAFEGLPEQALGYFNLAKCIRNCSAVATICSMIRKSVFLDVGGFHENYATAYGDADLCLRLRNKDCLIVYTPFSVVYHKDDIHEYVREAPSEEADFIRTWEEVFAKGDPYYNRNLTHLDGAFSVAPMPPAAIPLALLLELHYRRADLKAVFPEVSEGKYQRLIDWAMQYGIQSDNMKSILKPYRFWYINNATSEAISNAVANQPASSWTENAIRDNGERVTHLFPNDCYYAHLSIYNFARAHCINLTVLDAGSGAGYGTAYLANNGAKEVWGIDVDEQSISFSNHYFTKKNLKYEHMDLQDLSNLPSAYFDIVFTSNVLEHLPDVHAFLCSVVRVIKSEGALIVAVPPVTDEVLKQANVDNDYHLNIWSPRQWYYTIGQYFSEVHCYRHHFEKKGVKLNLDNLPKQSKVNEQDFLFTPVSCDDFYKMGTITVIFIARKPKAREQTSLPPTPLFIDDSFTRPGIK
jgi:glycosyltransferase involved in cell wall biosynthesis